MASSLHPVLVSLTLFLYLVLVQSYPDGNMLPLSVCTDMKPRSAVGSMGMEGHLLASQNMLPGNRRDPPYYITIHQEEKHYTPGDNIRVSVVANQTKGSMFYTGLLLQARRVTCASNKTVMVEDVPLGSFNVPANPRESLLATMDCNGDNSRTAVRHRSKAFKINETFTWKAPNENVGHVVFRAVIVHVGDHYWSNINSRVLREPGHPEVAPPTCGGHGVKAGVLSIMLSALYIALRKLL